MHKNVGRKTFNDKIVRIYRFILPEFHLAQRGKKRCEKGKKKNNEPK